MPPTLEDRLDRVIEYRYNANNAYVIIALLSISMGRSCGVISSMKVSYLFIIYNISRQMLYA